MRLSEVTIGEFKNLRNLTVAFDDASSYTVLVGENGAGKSNFIEALTLIFRNLDLEEPAPFDYRLKYRCRESDISIDAASGKQPHFWARRLDAEGEYHELSRRSFLSEDEAGRPYYRPAFVFGYYSGPSDRLASLYEKHRERFYSWIIRSPERRPQNDVGDPNDLRRLFYAQTLHGQFVLLAFFMEPSTGPEDDRTFLRENLQIDGLDSVLFVMNRPIWGRSRKGGDTRFWNAEGEVRQFLDRLYRAAMLPTRMDRRVTQDVTRSASVESLYLFLPNSESLEQVYNFYGDQYSFFTALESTHLSKLLGEVRTRVRMTQGGGGGEVTYRDLSEGEQQLLLVLGLLKFTARDEALFLLDEPDTHLNPVWGTQYLGFLDRFIKMRQRQDTCHIVMSSHDPLVFAGLKREQVCILRRDGAGHAVADIPDQDPRGMGVAAILTSDLFRLRTTLDPQTQADLDRQRNLAVIKNRTSEQDNELRQLNLFLRGKGLTQATRDPLYERFIRAWTEHEDPAWAETVELTPEQLDERNRLAAQIVEQLRREDAGA